MELLDSEILIEGHALDLVRKTYRREEGTVVVREVAEHPGSVAVVAHDEEFVYLVAQPREAVEEDRLLEIPAGTLDVAEETPLQCAQRELAEEAELRAEEWRRAAAAGRAGDGDPRPRRREDRDRPAPPAPRSQLAGLFLMPV